MMSVLSFTLRNENSPIGGGLLPVVATGDHISEPKEFVLDLYHIIFYVLLANNANSEIKIYSSGYISMIIM